ncbi:imidazole glycerol phosphate synthase subunit HisH [Taibaiella koreensis]|uniref:imidazole glycerol phosphate synthase subunit HisH n=1 Tax=Taibaiella koreensis TaxID=1268548 RepID=UPI000E59EE20|nr:imidazole glycerol phosphate synthase subunit HisH [Taibaiella koreensis]
MIAIIDYGVGNIGSVINMFKRIGVKDVVFTRQEQEIAQADKILLPGVGAFDRGMECLGNSGLIPILRKCALEDKKPFLGICLGMQLLTKGSEEGQKPGLGFIDAETVNFSFPPGSPYKIPHMGWNTVTVHKPNPLLDGSEEQRFYFVHSYYVHCNQAEDIMGTTDYGSAFTCAIQKDNIFATQFHPEKSHKYGMKLLQNFSSL